MLIKTKNLSKNFGRKQALTNISLNLEKGRVIGLFGNNGSGKTTLMKLITNQLKSSQGEVYLNEQVIHFNKKLPLRIGCVLENPSLYPYLTAREHLELYGSLAGDVSKKLSEELIVVYGLEKFLNVKVKEYSLGMRQRLALAIAEIFGKDILILDEPFNGLDPITVDDFRKRLLRLKEVGKTIIISSHLIRELEEIIDDLVILYEGELLQAIQVQDFMKTKKETLEEEVVKLMRREI